MSPTGGSSTAQVEAVKDAAGVPNFVQTRSARAIVHRPPSASAYLSLAVSTLAKLRLHGRGPAFVRLSPRAIGYLQSDLDEWLASNRHGCTSEYEADGSA